MPKSPDLRRNKTLGDLVSNTRKPKLLPETGWYRLAITELFEGQTAGGQYLGSTLAILENSWVGIGSTSAPPSFYLSEDGETRFRGKVSGGAASGEVMTVLPEEVRPQYAQTFIVPMNDTGVVDLSLIRFRTYQEGTL